MTSEASTATVLLHYRQQLQDAGIEAQQGYFPEHLILSEPVAVRNLPGYAAGLVSVQEFALCRRGLTETGGCA